MFYVDVIWNDKIHKKQSQSDILKSVAIDPVFNYFIRSSSGKLCNMSFC